MTILVTGGLGFIGSNTCKILLEQNYNIVILDNLSNSKIKVLDNLKKISKCLYFYNNDIRNNLDHIFSNHDINYVIHFAGLKSVNESISNPIEYYDNNVTGSLNLLSFMKKYNVKKIIFSSSSTVYGDQIYPVNEINETGKNITNPYGKSKYIIEEMLKDIYISDNEWSIYILRYFNPVGADSDGIFGEDPNGIPGNLFPYILGVANKKYDILNIYGNDYDTPDGTCMRDFIHVVDLAEGHILCIKHSKNGLHVYNLGTSNATSVLNFVNIFVQSTGISVPYKFCEKREGDLPIVYANCDKIKNELKWECKKTLKDACIDGWKFISNK